MTTKIMNPLLGDLLKWETNPAYTREVGVLAAGDEALLGTVVGRVRVNGEVTVGTPALGSGATGNGTMTMAETPHTDEVREGTYVVTFTSATKAKVEDPAGVNIGVATVGSAFSKHIAFTLAAGGTAFAAGDRWTVHVSIGGNAGALEPWDPTEQDGVEEVAGVLVTDVPEREAGLAVPFLARGPAIVAKDRLIFADGVTDEQKSDAYVALGKLGIAVRDTA